MLMRWTRINSGPAPAMAAIALAALVAAAYGPCLSGPPLFDDAVLFAPPGPAAPLLEYLAGPMHSRPVVALSVWLDGRLWGSWWPGWHATNLAIHAATCFLLYLSARDLLGRRGLGLQGAGWAAFAAAALWAVHPLASESVAYLVQRSESLAALFALASALAFFRAAREGSGPARRWTLWLLAAIALVLGLQAKAVVAGLPLALLLLDRALLAGSFRASLRARWPAYALLALALFAVPGEWPKVWAGGPALPAAGQPFGALAASGLPSRGDYLATQPEIVLHYVRLAAWPVGQCADYAWRPHVSRPAVLAILAAAGAIGAGLWRNRPWAAALAASGVLLAPTSSIIPMHDLAGERRAYLALAIWIAIAVAFVGARVAPWAARRPALARWAALALGASLAAFWVVGARTRAGIYASGEAFWTEAARSRPGSWRARANLATELAARGRLGEARAEADRAIDLAPREPKPRHNRGLIRLLAGDAGGAMEDWRAAEALAPDWTDPVLMQGIGLLAAGRYEEGEAEFSRCLALHPSLEAARLGRDAARTFRGLEPERREP